MTVIEAPTLRKYQTDALAALCAARDAGANRLLVKSPTGTGKTVTFAELLKWPALKTWLASLPKGRGAQMLVIAHREELLDQAADKIRRANPGLIVDIEQGARKSSRYSDIVIASIQTLAAMKFRRLQRLIAHHTFPIVIVDEAHHAAAATYRTTLAHLGFLPFAKVEDGSDEIEAAKFDDVLVMEQALEGWDREAPKDRLLVGFTATPNRSDAIGLGCVFQSIAYSYGLKDAIEDGWLVPIRPWVVETTTSLDGVEMSHGDFNQKQLADAVNNERRNQLAVAAWREHADGRSTIAFTVDVAHAHDLAAAFRAVGVPAEAVSGETPKEERRDILRRFTAGTVEVITNCMVLTEGTDLPRTSCILHTKPTRSATLYEQMTGRGLRLFPEKAECIVLDLVDVARRHSLQTAPVLYGLPPSVMAQGDELRQMLEEFEALKEKYPAFDLEAQGRLTLAQLRAKASTFDVWAVQDLGAFGRGRAMDWIKTADDEYRLQYPWSDGIEILMVSKDLLGHWAVTATLRPKDGSRIRQRTLATQVVTSDAAAGIAEAFVLAERRSVQKLTDKTQPWRGQPASGKQINLLRKLHAPIRSGLTAGEASNMIDLAMARRGRR
jgi:ATP-dependent helicase IRC3